MPIDVSTGEAITTIDLIVGFVAEQALMGVSDPDDDSVARTYYDVSNQPSTMKPWSDSTNANFSLALVNIHCKQPSHI